MRATGSANKTCLLSGNTDFEDESGPSVGYRSDALVDSINLRTSAHILCNGLGLSCSMILYPSNIVLNSGTIAEWVMRSENINDNNTT